MRLGLEEKRAWRSARNGRSPWWNAGASHLNQALPKRLFARLGLLSLVNYDHQLKRLTWTAVVRNRMPGGVGGRREQSRLLPDDATPFSGIGFHYAVGAFAPVISLVSDCGSDRYATAPDDGDSPL